MGMYGAFTEVVEKRIKEFGPDKLKEILLSPPVNPRPSPCEPQPKPKN